MPRRGWDSLSDSGSGTGAASLTHLRSNAVNAAMHNMLTSTYSPNQVCYSNVCAVRDEEAAGSNPATPTQVTGYDTPAEVMAFPH